MSNDLERVRRQIEEMHHFIQDWVSGKAPEDDAIEKKLLNGFAGGFMGIMPGGVGFELRWAPILPALSERFTVYACDRRGRGTSGDGPSYTMQCEFEDVAAVVDGIGGPVDLLGHSYGALCALEAAVLARNLRRLVLYEPPIPAGMPITPERVIDRLQALLDAGDNEGVVATFTYVLTSITRSIACSRSRTSTGLTRCSTNPAARERSRSSAMPQPLSAIAGGRLDPVRRVSSKPYPLPSGRPRSLIRTSNRSHRAAVAAEDIFSASTTSYPCNCSS